MRKTVAMAIMSLLLSAQSVWSQTWTTSPAAAGSFGLGAEGLAWWFNASPTPTPIITDGLYGRPATNVLLGGGDQNTNPNAGFRVTGSYAVTANWAIEGNFLYFNQRSTTSSVESSGTFDSTDLLLPFFDVTHNRENVTEISFSPVYKGSAQTQLTNSLAGAEINAAWGVPSAQPWSVGWLAGFRWLRLKEAYAITTSSSFIPPNTADIWETNDTFDTSNNFYGAQVGARARYDSGQWFAGGVAKVGIGAMVQKVGIGGSLVTNDFSSSGANQTFPGGYFALPTNIGSYSRTEFAVVPEVQLNVGLRLTPTASIYAGYSFLYASSVVRPGNQVDRNVNPTQSVSYRGEPPADLVGPAQPTFSYHTSSFWAQGVSVGVDIRF